MIFPWVNFPVIMLYHRRACRVCQQVRHFQLETRRSLSSETQWIEEEKENTVDHEGKTIKGLKVENYMWIGNELWRRWKVKTQQFIKHDSMSQNTMTFSRTYTSCGFSDYPASSGVVWKRGCGQIPGLVWVFWYICFYFVVVASLVSLVPSLV